MSWSRRTIFTVHISALRRALDEGKPGQSLLVTVPGRGYRLIGMTAGRQRRRRAGPVRSRQASIAVLPFQNFSGDPEQDYFADGIVEDIITALSRLSAGCS